METEIKVQLSILQLTSTETALSTINWTIAASFLAGAVYDKNFGLRY